MEGTGEEHDGADAENFSERVNSVGNQVLTKGSTLLGPDEINKVVVLRMNRVFMK